MPRETENWDEAEQRVLREALRLGFEVGFRGQIEKIDWAQSRYQELESEASQLGIIDDFIEKYEAGKEFGKMRRLSSMVYSDGGFVFKKRHKEVQTPRSELPRNLSQRPNMLSSQVRLQRVASEEAIKTLSELMRVADQSEKLRERIEIAFACLADAHDILAQLERYRGDTLDIMMEGLQILIDVGWLDEYEVVEIDSDKKVAIIDGDSVLAKHAGDSKNPICKPLCIALETIGTRAFGTPISVIEKKCISQGDKRCRFAFSPRLAQ